MRRFLQLRTPNPNSVRPPLIVNADDFGLSHSINEAVIRAHREGILTTASLMVNEAGLRRSRRRWRGKTHNSASACI